MLFDTNDTGRYFFDSRQTLNTDELIKLEDKYYTGLENNPSSAYKNYPFINVADKTNQIATYVIIGIAIILPLLSWFVFFRGMEQIPRIFMTIGIPCVGIGILLFVKLYLRLTVKKRIYSETVDAECIGYARYFETESGETLMPNSGVPCVSPVFSYRYNGQLYTCCFDGFETSKDCSVALGPAKINICPEHPESIYSRGAQQNDVIILFAVVLFLAGVGLTIAGLMI